MQHFVKLCEDKINNKPNNTKQKTKNKYPNFLYFFVKDFYRNKNKKGLEWEMKKCQYFLFVGGSIG